MVSFTPLSALRPAPEYTDEVAAPPYDVMSRDEARSMIEGRPHSILRVTRSDAQLPSEVTAYDDRAYEVARHELARLINEGILRYDDAPGFYLYQQEMGSHTQVGFVGLASADDYMSDRIKKHEFTLPHKEDDRMRQVNTLGAHLGPVFVTHTPHADLSALSARYLVQSPEVEHHAAGVKHALWRVSAPADIAIITHAFASLPALYIADGHHRAAAAARVARAHAERGGAEAGHFLSVSFASDELLVLPYQRMVRTLGALQTPAALLSALGERFTVRACDAPTERDPSQAVLFPSVRREWGMYLAGQWYTLEARPELATRIASRPVTAQLDVSVLQDEILAPLLAVDDPRTCEHVTFIGGIRGFRELERRTDDCGGVAFALYPTSVMELMEIADGGEVMPPKSTWFEPKLRSGLLINVFDTAALHSGEG